MEDNQLFKDGMAVINQAIIDWLSGLVDIVMDTLPLIIVAVMGIFAVRVVIDIVSHVVHYITYEDQSWRLGSPDYIEAENAKRDHPYYG